MKDSLRLIKIQCVFYGLLPCHFSVFTNKKYANEDIALPEAILGHVKKVCGHQNIYVTDRDLQPTRTMNSFQKDAIGFILRAKEN